MLSIDGAQSGKLLGIVRVVELLTHGVRCLARPLFQLLSTFRLDSAFVRVPLPQFLRERDRLLRFFLQALLAVNETKLVGNA